MKVYATVIVVAAALAVAVGTAGPAWAGSSDSAASKRMQKEVGEALDAIASYSAEQKEEAVRKARSALNVLDARIAALEENWAKSYDKMSDSARRESREALRALRKQRIRLAEWYGAVGKGAADAWDEIKDGFVDGYRSLQESVNRAERKYASQ
jgi:hypothetical protein